MTWQAELLAALLGHLRARGHSERSARAALGWAQRFILFGGNRHPAQLGPRAWQDFIAHLQQDLHLGPRTCAQALAALHSLQLCLWGEGTGARQEAVVSRPR